MEYKSTLNMSKSGFPMRAGLPKREPEMLKHWEEIDLYNELLKKNEGKPLFSLHDGPPFSNGALHMGHALNKSLKDFITRMYAMRGYYTPYIPGWDNHGMPIESAIIKQNKLNHKAMSVADFRTACHEFADHYIDVQREGFKRMGVVGDWEHPYKTMDPGFEAQEVRVFGKMYRNGHIYKGLKPVYWCAHDETALAEAEIEYKDDPCTTVYVKFPMNDDLGKLGHLDKSKLFFVIWTTTIWTLPGNLAIALHPDESYAVVKAPNGEMYIMAEALVEKVMKIGGFDILEQPEAAKKLIGYLPEQPPLYPNETPQEYLTFVGEAKGLRGKELREEIDSAVQSAGIENVRDRLIGTLSKGYRQRVGIAQALLGKPQVIILDEPTVGLDPIQIIEIRDFIKELGKTHTVILSSHILSEVQAVCEQVLIISKGRLVAFDTPENLEKLLTASSGITFQVEAGKEPAEEILAQLDGLSSWDISETGGICSVTANLVEGQDAKAVCGKLTLAFAVQGLPVIEMRMKKANLEDVFLELTESGAAEEAEAPGESETESEAAEQ